MKKILLSFALAVGLLASASTMQAQVNMSRYITLTVKSGKAIWLSFKAAAYGTPVRIVSGSNTRDTTFDAIWDGRISYTADGTTMTVYGDLTGFSCSGNRANLTALDLSHNTQLEILGCNNNILTALDLSQNTQLTDLSCSSNQLSSLDISNNTQLVVLDCYDNNLSTQALDDIFCALPDRTGVEAGLIVPIVNASSSNAAIVKATTKSNATSKNWRVQYVAGRNDIPATTGTYVCGTPHPEPNMDSYITLTVKNGEAIRLDLKAAATNTPVRIVSGSNTQDITVGTSWYGTTSYTAGSTTMTVYGDIIGFDCYNNRDKLTAIDISHNTQLTVLNCHNNSLNSLDISQNTQLEALYCSGNKFTTATLDDIYCALPDRTGNTNGKIKPVKNSSDPNHATVLATNAQNAIDKNWMVLYDDGGADITTTGSYVCPQLNMSRYITLTVTNGAAIKLDLWAAAAGTPVRIVSGSNTQDITVGTSWTGFSSYTADGTTMTVYGDLKSFDCSKNGENLTALDASNNTQLMGLFCGNNNLSSLDVSKNTKLTVLSCFNNKLSRLDLSKNTQLRELFCYGNNFSTQALDAIYCALPDRTGKDNGLIEPVKNSSDPNHATVLATNAQNAIDKNWKVLYDDGGAYIHTTGSYDCSTAVAEAATEPSLTL